MSNSRNQTILKTATLILYLITILVIQSEITLLLIIPVMLIAFTIFCRIRFIYLIKRLVIITPFLVTILLINLLSSNKEISVIAIHFVKALLSIWGVIIYTNSVSSGELFDLVSVLSLPPFLSLLIAFNLRFANELSKEMKNGISSIRFRNYGLSRLELLHTYGKIMSAVVIKSYERSQRVFQSMELRGGVRSEK